MLVCVFFTIIKGISLGDTASGKWLTSFVVSVASSCLVTQPLQVALVAVFFVFVFRKSKDKNDQSYDHYDDGKPLNQVALKSWNLEEEVSHTFIA
jgi:hypothetical protein